MFFNPLVVPALLLGAGLYAAGMRWAGSLKSPSRRRAALAASLASCLPALSFLLYYAHLVREPAWYVEFRSVPGIELLSAAWGLPFGLCALERPFPGKWLKLRLSLLLVFVPFAKPIALPLPRGAFKGAWEDGVCLQSTMATCGPCALASVLRSLGMDADERDIARRSYSAMTGTENWYLIRHARRRGLGARFVRTQSLEAVVPPAILGVRLGGGAGHFLAYLGDEGGRRVIGEPLAGRILLDDASFAQAYEFTGDVMEFSKAGR